MVERWIINVHVLSPTGDSDEHYAQIERENDNRNKAYQSIYRVKDIWIGVYRVTLALRWHGYRLATTLAKKVVSSAGLI